MSARLWSAAKLRRGSSKARIVAQIYRALVGGGSQAEAAESLGLNRSSVSRVAAFLVRHNAVVATGRDGKVKTYRRGSSGASFEEYFGLPNSCTDAPGGPVHDVAQPVGEVGLRVDKLAWRIGVRAGPVEEPEWWPMDGPRSRRSWVASGVENLRCTVDFMGEAWGLYERRGKARSLEVQPPKQYVASVEERRAVVDKMERRCKAFIEHLARVHGYAWGPMVEKSGRRKTGVVRQGLVPCFDDADLRDKPRNAGRGHKLEWEAPMDAPVVVGGGSFGQPGRDEVWKDSSPGGSRRDLGTVNPAIADALLDAPRVRDVAEDAAARVAQVEGELGGALARLRAQELRGPELEERVSRVERVLAQVGGLTERLVGISEESTLRIADLVEAQLLTVEGLVHAGSPPPRNRGVDKGYT